MYQMITLSISKKYLLFICFFISTIFFSIAQNPNLDSLLTEVENTQIDSIKIQIYTEIAQDYLNQNKIEKGISYYQKIKEILSNNNQKGIARILANIGRVHYNVGEYGDAMKFYIKALDEVEKHDDRKFEPFIYNYMGSVFKRQRKFDKAVEYYEKGLDLAISKDDKVSIADSYNRIGVIYHMQDDMDMALKFYLKSLKIKEEIGVKSGIAESYGNMGILYENLKQYDEAIKYNLKSTVIRRELGDEFGIAVNLNNLGKLYMDKGNYSRAIIELNNSLEMSISLGVKDLTRASYHWISRCYKLKKKFKKALTAHELYSQYSDSLYDQKSQEQVAELEKKYETEKKEKEIELLNKEKVVQQLETEKNQAEIKKGNFQKLALAIGFVFTALLSFIIFRGYKQKKNSNQELTEKNTTLHQYNEEILTQREEIEQQKDVLELKNSEITDSIKYAKRIQEAILPSEKTVKEFFPNSYVMYKPKDIIAGDFYWFEKVGDYIMFAAADCTGHGVPGAMVSVVCHNAMNRAVREFGLTDPGLILDKTREIVVAEFEKSEDDVKDGMDIALCSLSLEQQGVTVLQYAGAHNPLWIVRNGELLETKADKQPIGKFDGPVPFKTHNIDLQKGDTIYIFSDGYVDQFGGEKDKKFGSKRFKELLLSVQYNSMQEQKEILNSTFEKWMIESGSEQIDDVCIMCVII